MKMPVRVRRSLLARVSVLFDTISLDDLDLRGRSRCSQPRLDLFESLK